MDQKELEKAVGKFRKAHRFLSLAGLRTTSLKAVFPDRLRPTRNDYAKEVEKQYLIGVERAKRKLVCDILQESRDMRHQARMNKIHQKYISYAKFAGNYTDRDKGDMRYVSDYDGTRRMAVIQVDGWLNYTRRYGTRVSMSGLVLWDKTIQDYTFIRISPQISSINFALEFIEPAEIKRAKEKGKVILRQGDFYFIPTKKWNLKALRGSRHTVETVDEHFVVSHPQHGKLELSIPHRAIAQRQVSNALFGRARFGD